jgi:hypothetical protein
MKDFLHLLVLLFLIGFSKSQSDNLVVSSEEDISASISKDAITET